MDKYIHLLLPTPAQARADEEKAKDEAEQKRLGVGVEVAKQAMDGGASPEEAKAMGLKAIRTYDEALRQQQAGVKQ
jgi:hypothetical protein